MIEFQDLTIQNIVCQRECYEKNKLAESGILYWKYAADTLREYGFEVFDFFPIGPIIVGLKEISNNQQEVSYYAPMSEFIEMEHADSLFAMETLELRHCLMATCDPNTDTVKFIDDLRHQAVDEGLLPKEETFVVVMKINDQIWLDVYVPCDDKGVK